MLIRLMTTAVVLGALALPNAAVASQPGIRLQDLDRTAEDQAADQLATQLVAAVNEPSFDIDLPADYVSLDPNYDPLAGWSPD